MAVYFLSLVGSATAQESRIVQADQLYLQRSDLSRVREAISLLAEVVDKDAENYEALWRLTKYYYFLGTHAASNDAVKDALEQGIERGEQAVALVPDRPAGHFWLAASYGEYGQRRNVFKRWRLVKPMQKALEIVIDLDPSHENGSAYAVLGKLDSEVPGLFGGNRKRGISFLEKALDIGPAFAREAVSGRSLPQGRPRRRGEATAWTKGGSRRHESGRVRTIRRPAGHFWLAASYGEYGQRRNVFKRWRLVKPMQKALEIVIDLDPSHENGSAYAAGQAGLRSARVGGNRKRGISFLEKAGHRAGQFAREAVSGRSLPQGRPRRRGEATARRDPDDGAR